MANISCNFFIHFSYNSSLTMGTRYDDVMPSTDEDEPIVQKARKSTGKPPPAQKPTRKRKAHAMGTAAAVVMPENLNLRCSRCYQDTLTLQNIMASLKMCDNCRAKMDVGTIRNCDR